MVGLKYFIGIYWFIIIAFLIQIKAITLNFETNCNSYQFVHLENLIGSVHKHALEEILIFVRDMGLFKGQRMLLEQYQNVKIFSSTDIITERTQFIDVDKELVLIDGKYDIRQSNGKMLYVDSIHKRYQLAVVIPFIRTQLSNLIVQMSMSRIYTPCKKLSQSIDLIFYHNEGEQSSLEKDIRNIGYISQCYRNIRYFAVNLSNHTNRYPYGSFVMWQKLLINDKDNRLSLRAYGYTHFFLMEPDTRPIREFWLDAVIDQITDGRNNQQYFSTNWWVSGSLYRGTKMIGDRFLHINGNALYHLSSNFIEFVKHFSNFYHSEDNSKIGYDLVMYSFLVKNQDLGKRYLQKFRFSDFIQNCWHTGCEDSDQINNTFFILNNPYTYLIHGTYVKENDGTMKSREQIISINRTDSIELQFNKLYILLLICFVWFPFISWLCCRLYRPSIWKQIFKFLFKLKQKLKGEYIYK